MSQNSSFLERMGLVGSVYAIKTGIVSIQGVLRLLSPLLLFLVSLWAGKFCLEGCYPCFFLFFFFNLEQILYC